MRIVGGRLRGRPLKAPSSDRVRPTSDRNREAVFNILSNRIDFDGLKVIDLFAGTGALGIEAVSRGATFALFVEMAAESRALIRANVESLALTGATQIFRRDATRLGDLGKMAPFDLAFADPPYGKDLGVAAASSLAMGGWLKAGAMLVLEEAADAAPPSLPGFELQDRRTAGVASLSIFARGG